MIMDWGGDMEGFTCKRASFPYYAADAKEDVVTSNSGPAAY